MMKVTVPETKTIVISELQDQPPFTKITTSAKIIEVDEVVTLTARRCKMLAYLTPQGEFGKTTSTLSNLTSSTVSVI